MGQFMKVIGLRISSAGRGCSSGQTAVDTRGSSKREKSMDRESIFG